VGDPFPGCRSLIIGKMRYYLSNPYLPHAAAAASSDAIALSASLAVASLVTSVPVATAGPLSGFSVIGAFFALYYCDAYSLQTLACAERAGRSLLLALGLGFLAAWLVYFFVPLEPWVLPLVATASLLYMPTWLLGRFLLRYAIGLPSLVERVAIVGVSDLGLAIAQELRSRTDLGTRFLGFLSDQFQGSPLPDDPSFSGETLPVIGRPHEVSKLAEELRLTRVVAASKSRNEFFPAEALMELKLRGVRVISGSEYYEQLTGRVYLSGLRESYLIFGQGFRTGRLAEFIRRGMDISGALLGLLVASPVLLLAALAIKLDSPGRVFFRQDRVGRHGRTFRIAKLRTMFENAERTGPRFASKEDDRITRVGHFLRRTRLDEVPQLWNVLRGQMSLVGPRPERPEFVQQLGEQIPLFGLRTGVKPGVTGWAQIRDGYANSLEDFQDKLAHDLYYMKTRSLGMDLLILWLTVKTMFRMDGV
jgi:exopolysaccharide biosynthesis polyprenyl glycosylphosphotransferase